MCEGLRNFYKKTIFIVAGKMLQDAECLLTLSSTEEMRKKVGRRDALNNWLNTVYRCKLG